MNLNEVKKRSKYKKIISLMICILLVFSIITTSYINVQAIAPAIPIIATGAALFAGLLVASGLSQNTITIETVESLWNDLPSILKYEIEQIAFTSGTLGQFGMATYHIGSSVIELYNQWFAESFTAESGEILTAGQFYEAAHACEYTGTSYISTTLQTAYDNWSGVGAKIILIDNSVNPTYHIAYKVFVGEFSMYMYNNRFTINSGGNECTRYWQDSQNGVLKSQTGTGLTATGQLISFAGSIPIYDGSPSNIVGWLTSQYGLVYSRDLLYDPNTNPFSTGLSGDVNISIPVTDNPDTNVTIPPTTLENPVSLETVLQGYGSIDGFFDQGGAITLADGTVIGKLADAARGTSEQWSDVTPTSSAEPWAYQIPILGDILKWLKKIATAIGAGFTMIGTWFTTLIANLANPFNWEKAPKGPTAATGIAGFFPVLLALLIAIMHLIAKVIAFIGQLYTIPASSAMLHPTMVQGIEWARGFNSQTGVNLYSLVTGVISIVLGVVCFKLLRKMITGIGSASNQESNSRSNKFTEV